MEKRKWLWKRKPSERSPGETESSESISSHSERYSDNQDGLKASPKSNSQSSEVTSKATAGGDKMGDTVKILTVKLSAALASVSAKEDLIRQHAKVAEEAVAGWEKAENEVVVLKQQLEAVMQKNSALEDRGNHLDEALKECTRQLRQGREEQEHLILEAVLEKTREWECRMTDLEAQLELKRENFPLKLTQTESSPFLDPDLLRKLEFLERENVALKHELLSRSEELEIATIERDLSTLVAENASKQHLEGIKKISKLEAECRKLQVLNRKLSLHNDQKSVSAVSICVESLTDGQDSGEISTLINELDQIKSEKSLRASTTGCPLEMDIMDDFLEMERLLTQPKSEAKIKKQYLNVKNEDCLLISDIDAMSHRVGELEEKLKIVEGGKEFEKVLAGSQSSCKENQLKGDLEEMIHQVFEMEEKLKTVEAEKDELEKVLAASQSSKEENPLKVDLEANSHRVSELEEKLKMIEAEKSKLEAALVASQSAYEESQIQLKSAEMRLEALLKDLDEANASKEKVEFQLIGIETEARTMSSMVDSLKEEIEKEKVFSKEISVKCREFEVELEKKSQEIELQQTAVANREAKVEHEELEVAAGKLAECQKTIASLGRQLQSLATLEDFLVDVANLPGSSSESGLWKLHSTDTFISENTLDQKKVIVEDPVPLLNGNTDEKSPPSSISSKSRDGFGKLFIQSDSGVQLENQQQQV